MRRYVVIGAGAIGGTLAARLAQHGKDVVCVARGEHADAIEARGLTLHAPEGTQTIGIPVWRTVADAALTSDDVLILAVKTQAVNSALREWCDVPVTTAGRHLGAAGDLLPILLCTNGISAEEMAPRWFTRVFGVCVWCPATFLTPGEVAVYFTPQSATLHLSRVPAGLTTAADEALLHGIRSDLADAQVQALLPPDVMPWKRRKLLSNVGNIVDALLGPSAPSGRVSSALAREARYVLNAAGLDVVPDEVEQAARLAGPHLAEVPGHPGERGSSTWQSLLRGGSLESDYLNGEIVRLARTVGVPAPLNSRAAAIGRDAEAHGQRPGEMTADELMSALEAPDAS